MVGCVGNVEIPEISRYSIPVGQTKMEDRPIMSNQLYWWQGASGHGYVHTVYPIHAIPDFIKACNYIFARPRFDGTREPLYIGESGAFDQRLNSHEKLGAALRLGATEAHIHFLAESQQERLNIETDLRHGHPTPLN